jgi:hypothetical protein
VGSQLGRLDPLTGRRASSRPDPPVGDGREPGRWGPRGTHVSQAPKIHQNPSRGIYDLV